MFESTGRFIVRHRKGVFIGYLISVLVAGAIGTGMFSSLKTQGYDDLGSDSAAVDQLLKSDFDSRDASAMRKLPKDPTVSINAAEAPPCSSPIGWWVR